MPPVQLSDVSIFTLSIVVGDLPVIREDLLPWYFAISDSPAHRGYVLEFTSSGTAAGGSPVTITGFGFDFTGNYSCKFGGAVSKAAFVSSLELLCTSPVWSRAGETVPLAILQGDAQVEMASGLSPARFTFVSHWSLQKVLSCSTAGGNTIAVVGAGFDLAASYELIFVGVDRAGRQLQQVSSPSHPSATDLIKFACPSWLGYEQQVKLELLKSARQS